MPNEIDKGGRPNSVVEYFRRIVAVFEAIIPISTPNDGQAHVALPVRTSVYIVVLTGTISLCIYGGLMMAFQINLHGAVLNAPVIRDILEPSGGQPLRPLHSFDVERSAEPIDLPKDPRFDDSYPLRPDQWLEVLKRLGLVNVDLSIEQVSTLGADVKPAKDLIDHLRLATDGQSLATITPLHLLTRLAVLLDGADNASGDKDGDSAACYEEAIAQVIAGYPGRWGALAKHVQGKDVGNNGTCRFLIGQDMGSPPSIFPYLLTFWNNVPSQTDIVRTLFEGVGAVVGNHPADKEPGNSPKIISAETLLAEQFGRQLLGAAMTTPDVRGAKLWLDMLVGLPQAILNWFFIMLMAFVCIRMVLFAQMRKEIKAITDWLVRPEVRAQLSEESAELRSSQAALVAAGLERLQRGEAKARVPSGSHELEASSGAPPTQVALNNATADEAALAPMLPIKGIRRDSLVALMAEKAIRRLIVGTAQPELFREFCIARRAMVDESAWVLRYLARALPALGFVGTILGILFALAGADAIVRASTQAERVAAMAGVTGPLAFAFSHTFMALTAGLIAGFFIDRQTARERLALFSYEETLVEAIDVAERIAKP